MTGGTPLLRNLHIFSSLLFWSTPCFLSGHVEWFVSPQAHDWSTELRSSRDAQELETGQSLRPRVEDVWSGWVMTAKSNLCVCVVLVYERKIRNIRNMLESTWRESVYIRISLDTSASRRVMFRTLSERFEICESIPKLFHLNAWDNEGRLVRYLIN